MGDHTPSRAIALVIDAVDVDALREFWVAALGYDRFGASEQYRSAVPRVGSSGPKLVFQQVAEIPAGRKNRLHIDVVVGDEMESEAMRLEQLGGSRISDVIVEAGTEWIVMADPDGNHFCLVKD